MCSARNEDECGQSDRLSSVPAFVHLFIDASLPSCCLQCIDISGLGFLNLYRIDWTNQMN